MKRFLAWVLDYPAANELERKIAATEAELTKRMNEQDKVLEELHNDLKQFSEEIRERLDMPQKRKSSGRPFTQLRAMAEAGERAARERTGN